MGSTRFSTEPVSVRVPATSANLGPGFDALGLALSLYDEVEVEVTSGALRVEVTGEGADTVGRDEDHLVVHAIRTTFELLGADQPGLVLRCTNRIPHGRGLGSSSAAIVAGILAARALVLDDPDDPDPTTLDDRAALELADELEGHPDNVAACLLGGLTVAWRQAQESGRSGACAVRVEPAKTWVPVAFVADTPLSTSQARGLLPSTVSHVDAARNAGRSALLVAVLLDAADLPPAGGGAGLGGDSEDRARAQLLLAATEDRLHQEQRAPSMPPSLELVRRLRADGVPAVVSGAGPTVLALARRSEADAVASVRADGFEAHQLEIDHDGAVVHTGGRAANKRAGHRGI